MYSKNFSPYREVGFGQIDPFDKKSSFDVPRSDSTNIPKNYRGIYFSQKKPESSKKDAEESVIRHAVPEMQKKTSSERKVHKPAALPPPSCDAKCTKCELSEDKPKKECEASHKLDLEDLLIAGLIVVLLREGANDMLPLELALLLL